MAPFLLVAQLEVSAPTDPAVRYFKTTFGGKTQYIAEDDMDFGGDAPAGVTFSGGETQIAYGTSDGNLTGELALSYNATTDYLTSFNYKTLRLNGMETQIRSGTDRPLSFNSNNSGTQVSNLFSYVNSGGGSDDITGIIGYRRFSGGPNTTLEGFFLSTRSFGGGPGYGNHSMFIGWDGVDLNGRKLTGLAAPSAGNSATTKDYVDAAVSGAGWNHIQSQDIVTGAFGMRNAVASPLQTFHLADEFQIMSDGAGNDWKFDDERMLMPLLDDDVPEANSYYLKTFDESGTTRFRPFVRLSDDHPVGVPGALPSSPVQMLTDRDVPIPHTRTKPAATTRDEQSLTSDPDLQLNYLEPGLHDVRVVVVFSSPDDAEALAYKFFTANIVGASSGYKTGTSSVSLMKLFNDAIPTYLPIENSDDPHIFILEGVVEVATGNVGQLRFQWGTNGLDDVEVQTQSFITAIRRFDR